MNGLDLLEAEELVSEPVKEPAKRWRNWWRAIADCPTQSVNGGGIKFRAAGDCWPGVRVYPCKDTALSAANDFAAKQPHGPVVHVDALPDGETPP